MLGLKPHLTVPPDVGASLDRYAAKLSTSLNVTITRQQAFERLVRILIPKEAGANGK